MHTGEQHKDDPSDNGGTDVRARLIVGIGASAGGLEASQRFFRAMPADSGMAFVLVMHLAPSHESHIAEILKATTSMEVVQVSDRQPLEPDHVYVIAPNSSLEVHNGVLRSGKPSDAYGRRKPIDAFFSSLAEDQKERAVAIVLSGAGNNGSAGIQDIKDAGGLCMAQDPETAQYDSMPNSTIGTGVAHHILPPEQMPRVLLAHAGHTSAGGTEEQGEMPSEAFNGILDILGKRHGLDFRLYKTGTLRRRTERRIRLKQIPGWPEYLEVLRQQPEEVAALYRDLLIGVTHFFRDREVWEYIETDVAPTLLAKHPEDGPLRIWVPGCATGEEAYSLAIVFLEQMKRLGRASKLQIYATDVNRDAIDFARRAVYPSIIARDVSPERLKRFFLPQGEHVQLNQDVRDSVTFAVHNLLSDPPFSQLDLVSCRNLLIYMEPKAQEKLLDLFHFGLRTGGLLVLGSSETIGRHTDLFEAISKKHRIYRSSSVTRASRYHIPEWVTERSPARGLPALPSTLPKASKAARFVEQLVLSRFTSACVAINGSFEILYFFGPTHDYLVQPTGEARLDLLSWVRSGMYSKLWSALREAVDQKKLLTVTDMRIDRGGVTRRVECTIEPIASTPDTEWLFLVAFRDVQHVPEGEAPPATGSDEPLVHKLESELKDSRQELHNTIEQIERTNEDYRASHEELLSLNEELQSSNEELETSKEELQSLNEEMVTINRQLEERNADLRSVNADMNNLFVSTNVPIIFLDRKLRVRRFTPAATEVMRLVASDAGRSIEHIKERVHDERLLDDVAKVLEKLTPISTEVATADGRWYARHALPYRTEDDRIDGVCVVFNDITSQKRAADEIEEARIYAEAIVRTVRMPLLVLDEQLRVMSANECFYDTFRVQKADTENRKIYDLGNRQWNIPRLRELLESVLPDKGEVRDYEVEHGFEYLGRRLMRVSANTLLRKNRPSLILISIEDFTERRQMELLTKQRADDLVQEHRRKDEFLAMLGHELRNPLSALAHGLDLLDKVPDDRAKSQQIRAMMERQTKRIVALLDQILDIARVVSGKIEISRNRVDLVDVARVAVETVTALVATHKHELTISLPDKSVVVLGDRIRLAQVVENLLTNAVKFMDDGGQIGLTIESDEDKAWIKVRDNGIGMTTELLPHVFDLFTQGPRTLDRSRGGLGLGLSLVRRLVEKQGGRVDASSPGPGQGSEFVVTLPRLREKPPESRIEGESARADKARSRRILVVDDEVDLATTLADLLEMLGHRALAVHDGPAALEAVRAFEPEVVLVDLGLPMMDGYEVATRLREGHDDKKLLLIALTGYQRDAARMKLAGFDEHLIKPPDMQNLSALLAAWAPTTEGPKERNVTGIGG